MTTIPMINALIYVHLTYDPLSFYVFHWVLGQDFIKNLVAKQWITLQQPHKN